MCSEPFAELQNEEMGGVPAGGQSQDHIFVEDWCKNLTRQTLVTVCYTLARLRPCEMGDTRDGPVLGLTVTELISL